MSSKTGFCPAGIPCPAFWARLCKVPVRAHFRSDKYAAVLRLHRMQPKNRRIYTAYTGILAEPRHTRGNGKAGGQESKAAQGWKSRAGNANLTKGEGLNCYVSSLPTFYPYDRRIILLRLHILPFQALRYIPLQKAVRLPVSLFFQRALSVYPIRRLPTRFL